MKIDLSNKLAIVTGSTRGIGFASAQALGKSGADIVLTGRTQATVDRALAALRKDGDDLAEARGFAADLGTAAGCLALVRAFPDCDILINNLGIYAEIDFFRCPDDEWSTYFETNVMSGVRLTRAYMPGMMERGWGRIVFISSESAINIPSDMIHYGFTKIAQLAISRGLAKLAGDSGVTVNAILPGPTRRTIDAAGLEFVRTMRSSSILQRPALTDEVANLVVYVASPQASATTGAALRVDGGIVETIG